MAVLSARWLATLLFDVRHACNDRDTGSEEPEEPQKRAGCVRRDLPGRMHRNRLLRRWLLRKLAADVDAGADGNDGAHLVGLNDTLSARRGTRGSLRAETRMPSKRRSRRTRQPRYPHAVVFIESHPHSKVDRYVVEALLYDYPHTKPVSSGIEAESSDTKNEAKETARFFADQLIRSGNANSVSVLDDGKHLWHFDVNDEDIAIENPVEENSIVPWLIGGGVIIVAGVGIWALANVVNSSTAQAASDTLQAITPGSGQSPGAGQAPPALTGVTNASLLPPQSGTNIYLQNPTTLASLSTGTPMTAPVIATLQAQLQQLQYSVTQIDGIAGSATQAAIGQFALKHPDFVALANQQYGGASSIAAVSALNSFYMQFYGLASS